MEIRIGVQNVAREIVIETNLTGDEVAKAVADAIAGATLDLSDAKGRRIVVPSASLGYVEIGEESKRRVGFGA
ncbi:DUF3107 domain-containing protein [Demequina sp. B12]|uniref:DUF3107 domain-containing protein n=1 Tax=Demequina sp. B12 TaxID=2992757 RepID=UPI00237C17BE|nr:DUF3107 domain-containing protein [Demequina sp. B12]MDE0572561.1 DUF3107 domain-containing protein [Demequina sp. B12]